MGVSEVLVTTSVEATDTELHGSQSARSVVDMSVTFESSQTSRQQRDGVRRAQAAVHSNPQRSALSFVLDRK